MTRKSNLRGSLVAGVDEEAIVRRMMVERAVKMGDLVKRRWVVRRAAMVVSYGADGSER